MAAQNCMFDVSSNNGVIDFSKLKDEFPAGAVMQVKATQGTTYIDSQFDYNVNNALKLGWGVMPYHFCNGDDPNAQWLNFLTVTKLSKGMAYMLDWERYEGVAASVAQMDIMGQHGVDLTGRVPMGYWGSEKLNSEPEPPSAFMESWDRQVPRYRSANDPNFHNDDPGIPCLAYQYTCWGRLAGIENGIGDVDRSVLFMGSVAEAIAYCQGAQATATPPSPQPAPSPPAPPSPSAPRLLRLGMAGTDVSAMQAKLGQAIRSAVWAESPTFGPSTDAAVRMIERANGLGVDGVVGPLVRKALGL